MTSISASKKIFLQKLAVVPLGALLKSTGFLSCTVLQPDKNNIENEVNNANINSFLIITQSS
jgi:hypothetical protein